MNIPDTLMRALTFTITRNDHKSSYQTVKQWLHDGLGGADFDAHELLPSDREECERTNEIWVAQWYPRTPVGSYAIAAPTLARLYERLNTEAGG